MPDARIGRHWERVARNDPYYGVLTREEYRGRNLSPGAMQAFLLSGEEYIEFIVGAIRRTIDKNFSPHRCLDFGCGVGRLVIPLAKRFGHVVGVDVSRSMLVEAESNCRNLGVANVEFVQSDDDLSRVTGKFGFVHSFIVFQHIPPPRGVRILTHLIERLEHGGVASLHFTYRWDAPLTRRAIHWARKSVSLVDALANLAKGRRPGSPSIYMYHYSLSRLVNILHMNGCDAIHLQHTYGDGHAGVILMFRRLSRTEERMDAGFLEQHEVPCG
jgi:SAM-dependent methyltransferase